VRDDYIVVEGGVHPMEKLTPISEHSERSMEEVKNFCGTSGRKARGGVDTS
jgi:hypothetical protein